jgi:hypothetical protein
MYYFQNYYPCKKKAQQTIIPCRLDSIRSHLPYSNFLVVS